MKIGVDASRISVSEKTGTENYSYNLIREMVKDDKDEFVLYLRGESPEFAEGKNVLSRKIGLPRLWTQVGLAGEVLIHPPDVLFVPAHTIPVVRRPNLRTVVTIHDLGAEFLPEYHKFPQKFYLNSSTEYAAAHATHLIAVSESTKRDLVKRMGVPEDRISVVYESWDREIFHQPSREELERVRSKYRLEKEYLLFVGTIQPRKNLENLIKAFARSRVECDLVLAGKPGWLYDSIYVEARRSGLANRVKFLNHVPNEDLPALYGGAVAFVFPSLFEGFGIPVLEAMACGTAVLTSSATSLPEVAGDAALYVDPKDISSITSGIEEIVSNAKLRYRLLSKGKLQAQKFSWERAARETLQVLRRIGER